MEKYLVTISIFVALILCLIILHMEIVYIIACVLTAIASFIGSFWAVHESLKKERDKESRFKQHTEDFEKYATKQMEENHYAFIAFSKEVKEQIFTIVEEQHKQSVSIARLEEKIDTLQEKLSK